MTQQPDPDHIDPVMADLVEPAPTISRRRPDDHIRSDQARCNMTRALLLIVLLLTAGCFFDFFASAPSSASVKPPDIGSDQSAGPTDSNGPQSRP
jgi:hypothetical protein